MDDNPPETLEQLQSRHRKEAKDLQGRITSKKKNATKKTRKGVNSECEELERALKERQRAEIAALDGAADDDNEDDDKEAAAATKIPNDSEKVDDALGAKPPQQPTTDPAAGRVGGGGGGGGGAPLPQEKERASGAAAAQPPQQQQQQEAGKKRNRQKERLARRAAETEAAALAAEQEASSQTDHRAVEKTHMLATFATHGLVEHEIRPDGHCLFSAVADQLAAQQPSDDDDDDVRELEAAPGEPAYKAVRRRVAEYIRAHGDEYAGFLEEGVESYVRKIRDTAEWGGQIELAAVANVWGVEVWVVQDGNTEVVRPSEEAEGEGRRIWLAYYRHGYGLGEHYNSLRKKA